jgi:hypothetical protein
VICVEVHQNASPAEAGLAFCGFDGRISCRPSGSAHMRRRLDAVLGLRTVLQALQRPLRARPPPPVHPRWRGTRHWARDGSQHRIRQRLERPNCLEFDYSQTAWPVSPPLTIRQQQQLELKRKTYSFVLSLSGRLLHLPILSAYLTGHNGSGEMLLVQQQVRLNRGVLALKRSDRCPALHF